MFSIFSRKRWPDLSDDEIRKRSRILVIDDQDFTYLPLFKKDNYAVDKWDDVLDLQKLESGYYDVILLDIQGVGKSHSPEQGLGVLKHLKKVNPAQLVIAFSNADWSLKYREFFTLADASLAKNEDYFQFKQTLDRLLTQRFSLHFYVDRICRLAGTSPSDDPKLRKLAEAAIIHRSTAAFEKYLSTASKQSDGIQLAIKVASVATTILATLV